MLEFYSPILPSTHLLVTTRYRRSYYKLQGGMGNGCSHSNKLAQSINKRKMNVGRCEQHLYMQLN
jgi:hypothetical protein